MKNDKPMKLRIAPGRTAYHQNVANRSVVNLTWLRNLVSLEGTWVTVETKFLFANQFNIVEHNLRISAMDCDRVYFGSLGEDGFKKQLQERTEKDWPGSWHPGKLAPIDSLIKQTADAGEDDSDSFAYYGDCEGIGV